MELRGTSGQLTLGLAALMARPFARMGVSADLDGGMVARLQASPLGQKALDAATREALDLPGLAFSETFLRSLGTDARARLATQFVLATDQTRHRVVLRLAAAMEQDRICQTVLRRDRLRLMACLGEDAMTFGLRRAPSFASALAALALPQLDLPETTEPPAPVPLPDNPLFAQGRGLVLHVLDQVAPPLAVLAGHVMVTRVAVTVRSPDDVETDAVWRLIERGMAA